MTFFHALLRFVEDALHPHRSTEKALCAEQAYAQCKNLTDIEHVDRALLRQSSR